MEIARRFLLEIRLQEVTAKLDDAADEARAQGRLTPERIWDSPADLDVGGAVILWGEGIEKSGGMKWLLRSRRFAEECGMKSKLEQRVKTLEARMAALEKPASGRRRRGWLKLAGWAKDDPLYDEAMKLGAAWRKTS